jgi:hypothetical protein
MGRGVGRTLGGGFGEPGRAIGGQTELRGRPTAEGRFGPPRP